jgi:PadR family transcriptional regulator, regulatory protein PadR
MVLKTLDLLGPLHSYGVARRIEQISNDLLAINQGTLYPLLLKLEHEGAIASDWGRLAEQPPRALLPPNQAGHKQLQTETRDWEQTAAIIARFFAVKGQELS